MKAIHPGRILKREIDAIRISEHEIATALNVPKDLLASIIRGHDSIDANLALRLACYFSSSPELWLNLQRNYDLQQTMVDSGEEIRRSVTPRRPTPQLLERINPEANWGDRDDFVMQMSGGRTHYFHTLKKILLQVSELNADRPRLSSCISEQLNLRVKQVDKTIEFLLSVSLLKHANDKILIGKRYSTSECVIKSIHSSCRFVGELLVLLLESSLDIREIQSAAYAWYRLDIETRQIHARRGWLESAGMVETTGNPSRVAITSKGRRFVRSLSQRNLLVRPVGPRGDLHATTEEEHPGKPAEHQNCANGEFKHNPERTLKDVSERALLLRVFRNPNLVYPNEEFSQIIADANLPSGHKIDLIACSEDKTVVIEVKPKGTKKQQIVAGLYQCVECCAALSAQNRVEGLGRYPNVEGCLVLEDEIPLDVNRLAKQLGISIRVVTVN